jgi:hypothetical protein
LINSEESLPLRTLLRITSRARQRGLVPLLRSRDNVIIIWSSTRLLVSVTDPSGRIVGYVENCLLSLIIGAYRYASRAARLHSCTGNMVPADRERYAAWPSGMRAPVGWATLNFCERGPPDLAATREHSVAFIVSLIS